MYFEGYFDLKTKYRKVQFVWHNKCSAYRYRYSFIAQNIFQISHGLSGGCLSKVCLMWCLRVFGACSCDLWTTVIASAQELLLIDYISETCCKLHCRYSVPTNQLQLEILAKRSAFQKVVT